MTNLTAAEAATVLRDIADKQPELQVTDNFRYWLQRVATWLEGPTKLVPIWKLGIALLGVSLYVELRKGALSPLLVEQSKGRIEVYLGGFYIVACTNFPKRC